MSDQIVTNAQQPEPTNTSTATTQDKTGEEMYTKAQMEQIYKDRLAREREAENKRLQAATERAAAETAAKQGEWQKLAEQREKEAAELKARLDALELAARKRAIGAKFNLPEGLAERLTGTTDEELEADANKLKALLPPVQKPAPGPVNPGSGASQGETDAEKRKRLGLGI